MGDTLVMVVTLTIVLGLILVLLAELYCSLLLRRRQHKTNSYANIVADSAAAPHLPSAQQSQDHLTGPSLGSFLGILCAPTSFLSLPVSSSEEYCAVTKKQHSQPPPNDKISPSHGANYNEKAGGGSSGCGGGAAEHFVYISSPIYDNETIGRASGTNTPFQTPDMSPSRMEMGGSSSSSSGDEEVAQPTPSGPSNPITTPPLTPLKKHPAEACSVSLRDARSLGTSGSDSNSNNGHSSSSSGSPSTSPSW
ncbi:probable endo-1,3(4)-beta-glucanase An02g00850 [Pyrus communis]|uniref:probable endo-1,3(4)-beta-glucanase An02g00850 n=1 Tax=Pyrus communis TaxID=23211 RepID=UPI0035BEBBAF